jgi:hypothetical protein
MAGVRSDAESIFGSLAAARADRAELREPSGEEAGGQAIRMADDEQREVLDGRIDRLQASWEEQLATAGGIQARVLEAARQAADAIRTAARTSPTAGQNWLEDRWEKTRRWASKQVDGLKGWVAEHAAALRSLWPSGSAWSVVARPSSTPTRSGGSLPGSRAFVCPRT